MSFAKGFLKGAAESFETGIKDRLEETRKDVKTAADFHIRRRVAAEDRYLKDIQDSQAAIERLSGLTDGDLTQAASVLKAIGGPQNAETFYLSVQKAISSDPDIKMSNIISDLPKIDPNTPPKDIAELAKNFATLRLPPVPSVEQSKLAGFLEYLQ